ncbi:MAG: M15 family metallopeptidase [Candidatus Omnitrophica bacterium]|nr:M15 family metallopeptidase [Candidatus Omnitrophota bacterium]
MADAGTRRLRRVSGAAVLAVTWLGCCTALFAAQSRLVDASAADPTLLIELSYATADNFMGETLYDDDRCFLRPGTADKLKEANAFLRMAGMRLVVCDCYRPLSVQKRMFRRFPQPGLVADPRKGSNHNRAAAVDVCLADNDGLRLDMGSGVDEFSEKSRSDYPGLSPEALKNRRLLNDAMTWAGFTSITTEWWHYNDPDGRKDPVMDVAIKDLS